MLVYHVGFDTIKIPDIHYGRKNADFGQGFYLTDDKEFSYRWAKEKSGADTILNEYELDLTGLSVHEFTRGEDWFNYIYGNRHLKPDEIGADVIIGPIANDIIYDVLGITTSGFLPKDDAMKLFLIGPTYKQIVIKSEKAVSQLSWIKSSVLTSEELVDYHKQMKIEEEEFQELFAAGMEKLV
ncbi:Protein of unknown function [Pseudobutyrivibrio sp. ACV-2]|uniref:DUF3990 domain-containing protein n=1 Tax=Pseudobutyrivibrio sp. ACV-2 TaxID=1520801 RepID=UPI00089CD62F|nr:DUF3990 domain-containing protein [Pseudobutyrivibrio sp. ACV-2]SDZ89619.1 Protein of unknown function [Pseudobutyrivibrio sp. ACV-2]